LGDFADELGLDQFGVAPLGRHGNREAERHFHGGMITLGPAKSKPKSGRLGGTVSNCLAQLRYRMFLRHPPLCSLLISTTSPLPHRGGGGLDETLDMTYIC
jgi:hypothetical protein